MFNEIINIINNEELYNNIGLMTGLYYNKIIYNLNGKNSEINYK